MTQLTKAGVPVSITQPHDSLQEIYLIPHGSSMKSFNCDTRVSFKEVEPSNLMALQHIVSLYTDVAVGRDMN